MNTTPQLALALPIGSNQELPTVNARDLHTWLEVGRRFSTWIIGRIEKYDFIEGFDYVTAGTFDLPNRGGSSKYRKT